MNFAGTTGVFQSYFTGTGRAVTAERPTAGMIDLSRMIDVVRTKAIADFRLARNGWHTREYARV